MTTRESRWLLALAVCTAVALVAVAIVTGEPLVTECNVNTAC